jgi:peptide/nickel transport system substrate-binding protein
MLALVASGATLFTVTGCGGADTPNGQAGGSVIVVVPAEPKSLFPPLEVTTQGSMVFTQVFDRLANPGDDLNTRGDRGFTPNLATSWIWAPDSMSIAFTLDSAARWHDGKPLVAEDVRYTFTTYTSPLVNSLAAAYVSNIDSVSVRDAHTAVFWFKRRTPQQFFDATYHMFILPSHLLAQVPDTALATSEFTRKPVGTGRFRFAHWDNGERIEILADTGNSRGRAKLDRVIFAFTKDAGAALVRLTRDEVDFFEQIKPENFEQVARSPHLKLVPNPTLNYQFLGFNLRNPKDSTRPHPIFSDKAVRRALVLAADRDRIVRSIFDTLATTSIGPVPRVLVNDTTKLRRPPFSLEQARALLDSAGWLDTDKDGIRERNGVRLSFEAMAFNTSMPRQRAAEQLAEQYRTIGVEMKPMILDGPVVMNRVTKGEFDSYVGGFLPTPGLRGMPGVWGSRGTQNYQRYANPEFDAAMNLALMTFDEAESQEALNRALQIMWDDAPAVWLFEPAAPIGMHKRIQHATLRPDGWYMNLADWSIDPAQFIDRDRVGLRGDTR